MSKCEYCNQEMLSNATETCFFNKVIINGKIFNKIIYKDNKNCHDCNILPGGFHHPGCDMETCPQCKNQLISCECEQTDLIHGE